MEQSRRKAFCVWIVSPFRRKVRKVRCGWGTVIGCATGVLLLLVLCLALATDHGRMQFARLQDALSLQRISRENVTLQKLNESLESEVEELRSHRTRALEYESNLRAQLDQLSTIVRTARELGLVNGTPSAGESSSARSVGGAEIDCAKGKKTCPENAPLSSSGGGGSDKETKKTTLNRTSSTRGPLCESGGVSLSPRCIADEGRLVEVVPDPGLLEEINRHIELLRTIPIGSPAKGELTSHFGYRNSPFGDGIRLHEGLDVSLPHGSSIFCTADGVVEEVTYDPTYGLRVDVRHSDRVVTRYAHLSKALVKEGTRVRRAQRIALSGSTGRSTGPHLHYEIRIGGRAKDPMRFLKLAGKLDRLMG
jgi:murein DD-endopeptidase MepM/ murein hydrolase activator NlpD